MQAVSLLLDAVTLFFLLAYALSALVALLPIMPAVSSAEILVREACRRLLLPPVGAVVLTVIGLSPILSPATARGSTQPWFHLVGSSIGEATHDLAALAVLAVWASLLIWHAFSWGQARGYLNLLHMLRAPEREASLHRSLAAADLRWPGALQVVDCKLPLCFVLGVRHFRLILSTAILNELAPEHLRVVVAHELAHVARRDNLWRIVLQVTRFAHLPFLGQHAFRRWAQGAELACDEAAAARFGSICVAETLVRFQRLINRSAPLPPDALRLGSAFHGSLGLQTRVRRRLDAPMPNRTVDRWLAFWPLGLLLAVLIAAAPIHALLENLLELLHA